MFDIYKDEFFLMLIERFIKNNKYITDIPDIYDQMRLLYKTDVYLIFMIMYEESSQLWMSIGMRHDINVKSEDKVLSYVNNLPYELISHIISYIPGVNSKPNTLEILKDCLKFFSNNPFFNPIPEISLSDCRHYVYIPLPYFHNNNPGSSIPPAGMYDYGNNQEESIFINRHNID
jgi:hypothetical protein